MGHQHVTGNGPSAGGDGFGPAERADGWGLLLVERLAARWGVVASGTTLVWFELDLRAG